MELILGAECIKCGGLIGYVDAPTGGWWRHYYHPSDNHDGEINTKANEELEALLNLQED